MNYDFVTAGTFLKRPNRFLAQVRLPSGEEVVCHVKNTGRCGELLIPGVRAVVQRHPDAALSGRKTEYSLIAVYKRIGGEDTLVNIDSQAPNAAAYEWLAKVGGSGISRLRREVVYGNSRFDLAFDMAARPGEPESGIRHAFMEVKGVTLEQDGIARFPDAPTQRGVKHVLELAEASLRGLEAFLLFVIQMKGIRYFTPNMDTHPEFGEALVKAHRAGVRILARDCLATEQTLCIDKPAPVWLPGAPSPIHQDFEPFI